MPPFEPGRLAKNGVFLTRPSLGHYTVTREESERRQSLWWYLLMTGLLLLAAETVIANHLSRKEKFL